MALHGGASGQEGSLTLPQARAMAAERSPALAASRADAQAAQVRIPVAGALPDPTFQLGVMNVALPDLSADMPASMAPSLQLTQRIPFPGKRRLRSAQARSEAAMAEGMANEARWRLHDRVGTAFFSLYEADRHLEVQRRTLTLLRNFENVAKARYASGEGPQADVLRATVEVARMDAQVQSLEARRTAAVARLNGLVAQPSDTPVPSLTLPELPSELPALDTLRAWAQAHRPLLELERATVTWADQSTELADRNRWPDLMVGVQYGQRDRGLGVERMGSATVGISLPVFAGRLQGLERDAAAARARARQADLNQAWNDVDAAIASLMAEVDRAGAVIGVYRADILPKARATVASALASYRVGAVDFATLVDAQLAVHRFELELHTLVRDYGSALSALEAQVGRSVDVTTPLALEIP